MSETPTSIQSQQQINNFIDSKIKEQEEYELKQGQGFFQKLKMKKNRNTIIVSIACFLIVLVMLIGRNTPSFIVSALILNLALILIILNKYPSREVFTLDSYITVGIGFFIVFTVICILPLDAASNISLNNHLNKVNKYEQGDGENKVVTKEYQSIVDNITQDQKNFKLFWTIVYWFILILSGFYKVQNYYHGQGHIRIGSRLWATIKVMGIIGLGLAVLGGTSILIFKYAFKKDGVEMTYSIVLVLSQVYGITFLVFLLGYGLVQLPVTIWLYSNKQKLLDILLIKTEQIFQEYQDKKSELYEACDLMQQINSKKISKYQYFPSQIRNLIDKIPRNHKLADYKQQLQKEIPNNEDIKEGQSFSANKTQKQENLSKSQKKKKEKQISLRELKEISENSLADGRFILIQRKLEYVTAFNKWKIHLDQFFELVDKSTVEDIIKQQEEYRNEIKLYRQSSIMTDKSPSKRDKKQQNNNKNNTLQEQFISKQDSIIQTAPQIEFTVKQQVAWKIWVQRSIAVLCLLFSILILWSESILIFTDKSELIVLWDIIRKSQNEAGILTFIFIIQGYIIFCSLFTLFNLDLGSVYAAYPEHTHHLSMIFGVDTCQTIVFALCYNVMMIFGQISTTTDATNFGKENDQLTTGFDTFFKPLRNIPFFGGYYNRVVAVLIALVGILSLFAGLRKVFRKVVKHQTNYKDNYSKVLKEEVQQGQNLLLKEYQKQKNKERLQDLLQNKQKQDKIRLVKQKSFKQMDQETPKAICVELQDTNHGFSNSLISTSRDFISQQNESSNIKLQNQNSQEIIINSEPIDQIDEKKLEEQIARELEREFQQLKSGNIDITEDFEKIETQNINLINKNQQIQTNIQKKKNASEIYQTDNNQKNKELSSQSSSSSKNSQEFQIIDINKGQDLEHKQHSQQSQPDEDKSKYDEEQADDSRVTVRQRQSAINLAIINQPEERKISSQRNEQEDDTQIKHKQNTENTQIQQQKYKKGFVYKKAGSKLQRKMKGWVKKYMEYYDGKLRYWDEIKSKQGEELDIDDITSVVFYNKDLNKNDNAKEDNTVFNIYTKKRVFKLNTDSYEESNEWVVLLNDELKELRTKQLSQK